MLSIAARSVRSLIGIEYDLELISVYRPNHKLECKSLAAIAVFDWIYRTSLNSPIVHLLQCCYCQLCLVKKACTYKNPDKNTRLGDPLKGTCEDVIHLAFHMGMVQHSVIHE